MLQYSDFRTLSKLAWPRLSLTRLPVSTLRRQRNLSPWGHLQGKFEIRHLVYGSDSSLLLLSIIALIFVHLTWYILKLNISKNLQTGRCLVVESNLIKLHHTFHCRIYFCAYRFTLLNIHSEKDRFRGQSCSIFHLKP